MPGVVVISGLFRRLELFFQMPYFKGYGGFADIGGTDILLLFLASLTTPLRHGLGRHRLDSPQHSARVCLTGRPPSSGRFHFPNRPGADSHYAGLPSLVWSRSDAIGLQVWRLHCRRSRRRALSCA